MYRKLIVVGLFAALLLVAVPAQAITNGAPDGTQHPNVGGLVAAKPSPGGTWLYCSGTLISPTVFVTAAHCDEGTPQVKVTFDPAYEDGDKTYTGTWYADPLFSQQQDDPHDLNDVRMVATGTLNAINPAWLRISMNPATGNGGTCYGDSGGPNFLGATGVLAATTITGDSVCRATNVTYRLDTPSARAFLGQFVTLP